MTRHPNGVRILVLGATGMLGSVVLRVLTSSPLSSVYGTTRSPESIAHLPKSLRGQVLSGVEALSDESLDRAFEAVGPTHVINCVGIVKQLTESEDPVSSICINSLLPHRLAKRCASTGARLIHVSTDCVFSGDAGMYQESDRPDAQDLYGRSKLLGEVDYGDSLTIRTSIIGHELASRHGLVEWFLAQDGAVPGFTRAVFSGLTTVELACIIRDLLIHNTALVGLYHVSADPISKFDLLNLISRVYGTSARVFPDDKLVIDRSLDSSRFRSETGYSPPRWDEMVNAMHSFGQLDLNSSGPYGAGTS
ncbi:MAG: dTDP-4-dehydrorhamnose reductase family protein [Acidimicrobiales bacterium]